MTAEVTIKDGARLTPHPLRAAILGEVHARPFTPIETPRRVLHFAFDTAGDAAKRDRAALAEFCARRKLEPLEAVGQAAPRRARRRDAALGAALRIHHLYLGAAVARRRRRSIRPPPRSPAPMAQLPQPGPLLVALDLHLLADNKKRKIAVETLFDRASLAVAENSDGAALFATDFQADPAGFVRMLVLDRGLGAERAGAVVQRIVELETYRTLALLGLPEAQRLMPSINRIEKRLGRSDRGNARAPTN